MCVIIKSFVFASVVVSTHEINLYYMSQSYIYMNFVSWNTLFFYLLFFLLFYYDNTLVCSISLWGIHLIILVKRSILRFVSDVRTDTVACGFANIAGNKGGVGCAFCFNESMEIAFVSCVSQNVLAVSTMKYISIHVTI